MSSNADLLGEIAERGHPGADRPSWSMPRDQLEASSKRNAARIHELGGLVLIDDDPDYLSLAPDGTFRSRTRYQDDATGEWVSETEVIESALRAGRAVQPGRGLRRVRRGGAREAGRAPDRPTEDLRRSPASRRARVAERPQRPLRRRRRDAWTATTRRDRGAGRQGVGGALHLRPRPDLPGAEPAVRGGPDRAVPGRRRAAPSRIGDRRSSSTTTTSASAWTSDGIFRGQVVPEDGGGSGAAWRRPTTWCSSTTRRTSSATWPTASPTFPDVAPDEDEADDEGDDADRRLTSPRAVDRRCGWRAPSSSRAA